MSKHHRGVRGHVEVLCRKREAGFRNVNASQNRRENKWSRASQHSGGISVDRVHGLCRMGPLCFVNSLRVVETMFLGKCFNVCNMSVIIVMQIDLVVTFFIFTLVIPGPFGDPFSLKSTKLK